MSNIKGVISPKGEKLLAELADERVKWKNPIMERVDGKLFQVVIKTIDNTFLEKIPEEWQNPLEPIIEAAINKEWELAGTLISEILSNEIDVPWLDEASEYLLFSSLINLVLGLIMAKVESMRK